MFLLMQSVSLNLIKKELSFLEKEELIKYCLQIAKYKKENKEFLHYLLFEAHDEPGYIESVKKEIENQFLEMNLSSIYLAKKTIRKVLRTANKYIKYSGQKTTEIEILICFCKKLKSSGFPLKESIAIQNIYQRQVLKIQNAIKTLHEDLQYDYLKEMQQL